MLAIVVDRTLAAMRLGPAVRLISAARTRAGLALATASIVLPLLLFGFAAWFSYREILRDAGAQVDRTALLLEEHALKVFETQRLVIEQVNLRLRFMDRSSAADLDDLQKMIVRLQNDLDQVATLAVTDATGHSLALSRAGPNDPSLDYADRDWFQALRASNPTLPYVSRSYKGRTSGHTVFNLAARTPAGPGGTFTGAVAVSADRAYFENFYRSVEPALTHSVVLVRDDGIVLAAEPTVAIVKLPDDTPLRLHMAQARAGSYTARSGIDGVERISAYRKVGPYPVTVRYGLDKSAALASWRATLLNYGIVTMLAALALGAASLFALRQTSRETIARRRWQETAAELQAEAAERGRIEQQLRQSQKMEAVGRLTGGVAHDFNNLLTVVIGSLDLVRRRAQTLDERTVQLVGNALDGANRAAALTSRLLAFSRQQPLQPVTVEANQLVAGMSDLLRRTLGEVVEVETVLAGGLWPTLADPNQLESAILNLAVNARDAMPDGGRLTIETANSSLDEAYVRANTDVKAGQYVLIAMSDTGSGMAPEILAQVFEPFFTTKALGKGTGLGLSQVYGFAKQSGGHVAVYSEVGHGSTFKLYLPRGRVVASAAPRPSRVEGAETPERRSGETVLVVEDEPMVRRLSVAALEDAGFLVLQAGDGAAGLDIVRDHPDIALLFTDVVLGGPMNGRVLADAVLKQRPGLPVLFTTGYTRNAIIHHGRLDEGVNFIGKPFTSADLVDKVMGLLGARVLTGGEGSSR